MWLFQLLQTRPKSNTRVETDDNIACWFVDCQCGFRAVCGFRGFRYLADVVSECISLTLWISIFRQTGLWLYVVYTV